MVAGAGRTRPCPMSTTEFSPGCVARGHPDPLLSNLTVYKEGKGMAGPCCGPEAPPAGAAPIQSDGPNGQWPPAPAKLRLRGLKSWPSVTQVGVGVLPCGTGSSESLRLESLPVTFRTAAVPDGCLDVLFLGRRLVGAQVLGQVCLQPGPLEVSLISMHSLSTLLTGRVECVASLRGSR